ncbi:sensor histidine kinase [Phenylobacterium sp.]|uniref:sensor histidine kinase n=1 Tax=Phenylobacterium sp. TaxID=1871053 RepID=UPI00273260D3|nr:histidine kinase dimerization/phosphoacceptor domain -containing protein [Phenylobacterium sp.]MDP3853256.1 histidine kinase dimerization/phosphoacceptor domain -containing protein [Phenylobacterium sp.]
MAEAYNRMIGAVSLAGALIDTSPVPLLLFDGAGLVVHASPSFCTVFEILASGAEGSTLADLGEGEWDIAQLHVLLANALADGPDLADYETDLVREGVPPRRLVVNVQNLNYVGAERHRVLMVVHDVTDLRRVEHLNVALLLEKDTLLREREVLLQEMQHRVANSLQIIASVLLLKARTVKSEETRQHLRDAHDRVMSVAAVQQHLQASLGNVEVRPYLTKLCESLASSMIRESRPVTLDVRADEATVSSQEAVSLGLIVTELVINALKHAFPVDRDGAVVVAYRLTQPGWTLSVTDDGVGRPPPSAAVRVGLGTSVVEALGKQLGAKVVISDAAPGTRVELVNVEPAAVLEAA